MDFVEVFMTHGKVLLTDEQVATLSAPLKEYLTKDGTSETPSADDGRITAVHSRHD